MSNEKHAGVFEKLAALALALIARVSVEDYQDGHYEGYGIDVGMGLLFILFHLTGNEAYHDKIFEYSPEPDPNELVSDVLAFGDNHGIKVVIGDGISGDLFSNLITIGEQFHGTKTGYITFPDYGLTIQVTYTWRFMMYNFKIVVD